MEIINRIVLFLIAAFTHRKCSIYVPRHACTDAFQVPHEEDAMRQGLTQLTTAFGSSGAVNPSQPCKRLGIFKVVYDVTTLVLLLYNFLYSITLLDLPLRSKVRTRWLLSTLPFQVATLRSQQSAQDIYINAYGCQELTTTLVYESPTRPQATSAMNHCQPSYSSRLCLAAGGLCSR